MSDIIYSLPNTGFQTGYFDGENSYTVKENKKSIKKTVLKFLMGLIIFFLAVEVVFYFLVLPAVSDAKIMIEGNTVLSSAELKKIAGLEYPKRWALLDSSKISRTLASYPLIESAVVTKKMPDNIYIKITERVPVAVAFTVINGKTVPMEIDKHGVIFRFGLSAQASSLPVIGGLSFRNSRAGMMVNKQLRPIFAQIDILLKKQPVLLNEIAEIKIKEKKFGGYDLIIYPVQTKIKVISGKILDEYTIRYMMLALDAIKGRIDEADIEQVDIRGSSAVYCKRGSNE